MRVALTYEQAVSSTDQFIKRIKSQRTVTGLMREVSAFANLMIGLQAQSPIKATFTQADVEAMDVSGFPQLERMKQALVSEMLARADAAEPAYYRATPVGRPFRRRVEAALPLLDTFMRNATRVKRKNAQRLVMRTRRI